MNRIIVFTLCFITFFFISCKTDASESTAIQEKQEVQKLTFWEKKNQKLKLSTQDLKALQNIVSQTKRQSKLINNNKNLTKNSRVAKLRKLTKSQNQKIRKLLGPKKYKIWSESLKQ